MQPDPRFATSIRRWLTVCVGLVALMVLVGGVTRLSESGLSIVKWDLVSGTLPPLSDAAWQKEFADYQASPQYRMVNQTFTLGDFKNIFWLEYLHRLIGRVTGLAILLPFVYFAARRALPGPLLRRCGGLFLLVALQGTVGWIMVASGLHDQPRVAPIKLALHLLLAFALFAALLWTRWQVMGVARPLAPRCVALGARLLLALAVLQFAAGALVAGLRAGKTYNTYPLMDGHWLPDGLYRLSPWWKNHLENSGAVQFQHRMLALAVAGGVLLFCWLARHRFADRGLLLALAGMVALQFILGVATLLSVVAIPLASAHQLGALLLLGLLVRLCYRAPPVQS